MTTALVPCPTQVTLTISEETLPDTRAYLDAAVAPNTRRMHRAHWSGFTDWCLKHDLLPLPAVPDTVAAYLTTLATVLKIGTLEHRLATIGKAHRAAGYPDPTASELIRTQMEGIRRTHGAAPAQKTPLLVADLRAMLDMLTNDVIAVRDRALLLIGFSGAFRRSELVALDVADLAFTAEGLTVTVRRSKTDQVGIGAQKGIYRGRYAETCPVEAVRAWLDASDITEGAVFRPVDKTGRIGANRLTDKAVALVIKRTAAAGLDPAKYAGHSLRSGLATQAAINGEEERAIMKQTGHASVVMVRRYIRDGSLYRENVTERIGL